MYSFSLLTIQQLRVLKNKIIYILTNVLKQKIEKKNWNEISQLAYFSF